MSRNRPGTPGYSLPAADRRSPPLTATVPRSLRDEAHAEAERRGVAVSALVREALEKYLPCSRALPAKSTDP